MNLESLKIFCDVAELKSFSRAAEKHVISQSAISQQLAQMELAHKCQLIDRKKRPYELTEAGRSFYTACKDILARYEQLKSELNTLNSSARSRINVASIFSIGMHTLPPYTKRFMAQFQNVNVHVEYLSASKIYELVLAGDIDMGLVAVPKQDRNIKVYNFANEPLVFVYSPKYLLGSRTSIDIHQLETEKFIGFDRGVPTRSWIDDIFSRYNMNVRPVMEFDNIETIKRAVEINSGISILPKTAILQELADGTLKAVRFSNEEFVRPTGIILRKDRKMNKTMKYLIDLLTE